MPGCTFGAVVKGEGLRHIVQPGDGGEVPWPPSDMPFKLVLYAAAYTNGLKMEPVAGGYSMI